MKLKQVVVVRKDLNMRKGKMIAQAGHAVEQTWLGEGTIEGDKLVIPLDALKTQWLKDSAHTKICVSVNSEEELVQVYERAKQAGLSAVMITDFGLTEFKGQLTKTVVAIGPAEAEKVDEVTGHLPLL